MTPPPAARLVPAATGENTVPDTTELTALLSRVVRGGKVWRYAPKAASELLDKDISFLDYDWQLNKHR